MNLRRLLRDERGVTLIDLIMTIIIIAIAIPPIMALFIQVLSGSTLGVTVPRANALASTLFEEIRSKTWDETDPAPSLILGPDATETRATYDDIDDFDGMDESPPQDSLGSALAGFTGFRQQVSVCYVAKNALDTCIGGPTIYKRITVTVTDPTGYPSVLTTVISSY